MLCGRAFRAQLVTQGQRELYDYWSQSAGSRPMPSRSELDPFCVPKLLPSISLIDVAGGLEEARFTVAGTRLHDIYGEEVTGKRIDRVYAGARANYWQRVHSRVVDQGCPLHGVVRGPAEGRDHIVLFWLRLPLSQSGGRVDRILCYDTAGPVESARVSTGSSLQRYAVPPQRRWGTQKRAHCG